jgi:hypothetical protein
MRTKNRAQRLIVMAFFVAYMSGAQAQLAPLSCKMQGLLSGTAAMERDQGVPRSKSKLANDPNSDLTKREIKTILDSVHITHKNVAPSELAGLVFRECQSGR